MKDFNPMFLQDQQQNSVLFYGANKKAFASEDSELILSGGYLTGKTYTLLHKINNLCNKYPQANILITGKYTHNLQHSIISTFEHLILPVRPHDKNSKIKSFTVPSNKTRIRYEYPNGSRITIKGLENSDTIKSSTFDFIYVNQAEQLSESEWVLLKTRLDQRSRKIPYLQICGDANPDDPIDPNETLHWIIRRNNSGNLTLLHSKLEDNPTIYDPETGKETENGKKAVSMLNNLKGNRRTKYFEGKWIEDEEPKIYSFDPAKHIIEPSDIPIDWVKFRTINFGYLNPFVCQWWALSPDNKLYLYREIYLTQKLLEEHAIQINELTGNEFISFTAVQEGEGASERIVLAREGINTIAIKPDRFAAISLLNKRLNDKVGSQIFFFKNSLVAKDPALVEKQGPIQTIDEFSLAIYQKDKLGKPIVGLQGISGIELAVLAVENKSIFMQNPAISADPLIGV